MIQHLIKSIDYFIIVIDYKSVDLSLENEDDRSSFSKCYTQSVEINVLRVLIDDKSFFDVPIQNKEETYETNIKVSKNNNYTNGNLLYYDYFSNHYKLIPIDLSKQAN